MSLTQLYPRIQRVFFSNKGQLTLIQMSDTFCSILEQDVLPHLPALIIH